MIAQSALSEGTQSTKDAGCECLKMLMGYEGADGSYVSSPKVTLYVELARNVGLAIDQLLLSNL